MAGFLSNLVDRVGTQYKLPEFGISEFIGGGRTQNTGLTPQSQAAGYTYNAYNPSNYQTYGPQQVNGGYTPSAQKSFDSRGSVQGASTSVYGGSPQGGGSQPSQGSGIPGLINNYGSSQSNLINGQYDQYRNYLNSLVGNLPGEQQRLTGDVNNLAQNQESQINTARTSAQGDLNTTERKTRENQASTFKDLEENLRNAIFAANQVLGTRGASDSSGSQMYSYALTKSANKQRGNIQQNVNSTLADIDSRREKVNQTANQQLNDLTTWKNTQLSHINTYIDQKKSELQQKIANGELDRGTALQALNTQIFPAAMQYLQNIDSQVNGMRQAIVQWGMENISKIDQYKASLGQLSGVSAPQYMAQQMNILPQMAAQADQAMTGLSPSLFGNRKNENINFAR